MILSHHLVLPLFFSVYSWREGYSLKLYCAVSFLKGPRSLILSLSFILPACLLPFLSLCFSIIFSIFPNTSQIPSLCTTVFHLKILLSLTGVLDAFLNLLSSLCCSLLTAPGLYVWVYDALQPSYLVNQTSLEHV